MLQKRDFSHRDIILYTLIGAFLGGMLWRFRGSHGWGSESGLFNVAYLMLVFFSLIGLSNKKTTPLKLTFVAAAFMLTVPQWGTLNKQITGGVYNGSDPVIEGIPLFSAVIMMLLLGYMLAGLFGLFLGNTFSKKNFKIYHYLILIAVFFAVQYLFKATLAHPVLQLIQPQSVKAFQDALNGQGVTESVYKTYMAHFDNVGWAKKIVGGRNYFAEIEAISRTAAVLVCQLISRFVFRDKTGARISFVASLGFAFAITIADLFFLVDTQKYTFISSWSCWEYFTGFIACGILTLAVLLLRDKKTEAENNFNFIPEKIRYIGTYLSGFCLPIAFNILRPVILRNAEGKAQIPVAIATAILTVGFLLFIGIKSSFRFTDRIAQRTYPFILTGILLIQTLAYFVCSNDDRQITALGQLYNVFVILSFIAIFVFGIIHIIKSIKSNTELSEEK